MDISIHALREEGDTGADIDALELDEFLSTPSARRATWLVCAFIAVVRFLSTPSARRATRPAVLPNFLDIISIHALREEGDFIRYSAQASWYPFLSTPSARRATNCARRLYRHARYFYPRPPRGGRQVAMFRLIVVMEFLSTPSARRATVHRGEQRIVSLISIHALREEGDKCTGIAIISTS